MALYIGDKKAKLYHGDQHPASLYAGDKLITGYSRKKLNFTSQASVVAPYKAAVGTVVYGVGRQDGTPTPDNPVDPVFLEGAEVGSKGKNLLTDMYDDGTYRRFFSNVSGAKGILIRKGVYYTLSCFNKPNAIFLFTFGRDKTLAYSIGENVLTFMLKEDTLCEIAFDFRFDFSKVGGEQLEYGSTPTPYEPYFDGGTAKIPTLRALPDGSVRDEYDVRTGVLTRKIWKVAYDGSPDEEWKEGTYASYNGFYIGILPYSGSSDNRIRKLSLCNKYPYGVYAAGKWYMASKPNAPSTNINFVGVEEKSVSEWRNALKVSPLKIWYALETPIIEHYDPQILRQHPGTTILTETVPPQKVGKTVSGQVIAVDDSVEDQFKGMTIYGKTTQDGIPTPDNSVPLVNAGGDGEIVETVLGKNLIKKILSFTTFQYVRILKGTDVAIGIKPVSGTDQVNYSLLYTDGTTDHVSLLPPSSPNVWTTKTFKPYKDVKAVRIYLVAPYNRTIDKLCLYTGVKTIEESEYTPYIPQALPIPTPNGLPGIKVASGGNYTDENGQEWICDEVNMGRGVYVKHTTPPYN